MLALSSDVSYLREAHCDQIYHEEIVTKRKTKIAVISCWIFSIFFVISTRIKFATKFSDLLVTLVLMFCIVFVASSYVILYFETRRHQKKIKTQQMPQEEVERVAKDHKALKTTVYEVGAVARCFSPMAFIFMFCLL